MGYDELKQKLKEYSEKLTNGTATVKDYTEVKNHINTAHGAGTISNELKKDLGSTAKHGWLNKDAAKLLKDVPEKIVEKGGTAAKFVEAEAPVLGKVVNNISESGGLKKGLKSFAPLLGMLGTGAMAMGIGNKAMAGDLPGAAADTADLATDYIPGVSQAKMALQSDELGKGSDEIKGKEQFDFSPFKTAGNPPAAPQNLAINNSKIDSSVLPPAETTEEPVERAKKKSFDAILQKLKP